MIHGRLTICFLSSLLLAACVNGPVPKWDGKIWAGKSKLGGIIFTHADGKNELIKASDPRFDDFLAMSYGDFTKFISTYVQGCAKWKPGLKLMSAQEARERFLFLMTEMQDETDQAVIESAAQPSGK